MQMTSMIDCVFLLLIFFMVTSSFLPAERELDPAVKLQQVAGHHADLTPAVIEVLEGPAGGQLRLGSRLVPDLATLTSLLRQLDNPQDGAIVLVDDAASFDLAAGAIQACKAAGFLLVSYVPRSPSSESGSR
jgi:biopolymer transport protein ExbD